MGALHWDYDGEYSGGSGGFLDTLFGFIFFYSNFNICYSRNF